MLIDLHAHSSGISKCCRIPYEQVLEEARLIGLDGIALTNHYQKYYLGKDDSLSFAKKYADEAIRAKEYAKTVGMQVFFGVEATMHLYDDAHILLLGVTEDFVIRHSALYNYTMEQLYTAVKTEGGSLIQAHPFRNGVNRLVPLRFLDGLELSCHPLYDGTHAEEFSDIARTYGKILTVGGDYHADTYRARCGIYLPDCVTDEKTLGKYLSTTNETSLLVHEIHTLKPYKASFDKRNGLKKEFYL